MRLIPILCEVAYNREMAFMVRFMARLLKITIEESAEFLEKQLKNTRTASQKERIQVLWWLKTGQVQEHQELAHRLGRDKSTITRWLQKYRRGGLSELLLVKKAPGQVPHMTLEVLAGLKERLEKGAAFKSYGEIVEWLKKEYKSRTDLCNSLCLGALSPPSKTESATSAKCFTGHKSSGTF
jgi:transposase